MEPLVGARMRREVTTSVSLSVNDRELFREGATQIKIELYNIQLVGGCLRLSVFIIC